MRHLFRRLRHQHPPLRSGLRQYFLSRAAFHVGPPQLTPQTAHTDPRRPPRVVHHREIPRARLLRVRARLRVGARPRRRSRHVRCRAAGQRRRAPVTRLPACRWWRPRPAKTRRQHELRNERAQQPTPRRARLVAAATATARTQRRRHRCRAERRRAPAELRSGRRRRQQDPGSKLEGWGVPI